MVAFAEERKRGGISEGVQRGTLNSFQPPITCEPFGLMTLQLGNSESLMCNATANLNHLAKQDDGPLILIPNTTGKWKESDDFNQATPLIRLCSCHHVFSEPLLPIR